MSATARVASKLVLIFLLSAAGLGLWWWAMRGAPDGPPVGGNGPATTNGGATDAPSPIAFVDATSESGLRFVHTHAASERRYLFETMGSGAAFVDFDGDGDPDIYLVNGAHLGPEGPGEGPPPRNALYRNDGDGTFTDVTEGSGAGDEGYGMGCAAADFDGDGRVDIYVTNYGPNVLLRNLGEGRFEEVAGPAGVADDGWGASCLFGDIEGDGDLDLYVTNYLVLSLDEDKVCGRREPGYRTYCHVSEYPAQPDVLYRNRGDGTFEDVTRQAGVYRDDGKGLGVVGTDFDVDGDLDIYVANDTTPNFLFVNDGEGVFAESASLLGVAYGEGGLPEAGMGVDAGDLDGDGYTDIFVTNFSQETNSLYMNEGGEFFRNRIYEAGLGAPSLVPLGFGVAIEDLDLDGHLDLVVGNGHIEPRIALYFDYQEHAQEDHVFRNLGGGAFQRVMPTEASPFATRRVTRGIVAGDHDLDGDVDLLLTHCGGPAILLENRSERGGGVVTIFPVTGSPPRAAYGTRLEALVGGRRLVRELHPGGSYLCSHEPALRLGLGEASSAEKVVVRWPSGAREELTDVASGRYRLAEGAGLERLEPVSPR